MGCRGAHRSNFCHLPLAEPGPCAADVYRRSGDGLDVRSHSKHHPAGSWASRPGHARFMGVPVELASPLAGRSRLLHANVVTALTRLWTLSLQNSEQALLHLDARSSIGRTGNTRRNSGSWWSVIASCPYGPPIPGISL